MKTYVYFFRTPGGTEIYITSTKNEISMDKFMSKEFKSNDPDDLRDYIQNGFNEVWEEKPNFSQKPIWKGHPLDLLELVYEEVPSEK